MTQIEQIRMAGNLADFLADVLGHTGEDIRAIARYMADYTELKERDSKESYQDLFSRRGGELN